MSLPGVFYQEEDIVMDFIRRLKQKKMLKVERDSQTLATITLQNYFRMYNKLAGMTGTAETEEGEFYEIYKLEVVVIPTNRPVIRDDQDDAVYKLKEKSITLSLIRLRR